jgi:putative FmdB family regulatory protein
MPIFEYHCRKCKNEFEVLIRGDEHPECPSCGSTRLEKLISVPAAHTSSASSQLPVCGASEPDACGMGRCRTGTCPMQ